jgi:choline dehydrogenase-like flavoprotein
VLTNARGDRATAVEYVDAGGVRHVQEAGVVILAAFAVQTPRLLLASASPRHPSGLANSSGLVGRYLMVHMSGSVLGLFHEDMQNVFGVTGGSHVSQDRYGTDRSRGHYGGYQWTIASALKPNDLLGIAGARTNLFGDALHTFMQRAARGLGTMALLGECLPHAENRVELASDKDVHGVPLASVTHAFDRDARTLFARAMAEGIAVFKAAGATEAWQTGYGQQHLMGGTIMGEQAQQSVTNGFGQAHDVPNLIISGPGLFPSTGAVNPTYTIHALALRQAEHLLARWGSIA